MGRAAPGIGRLEPAVELGIGDQVGVDPVGEGGRLLQVAGLLGVRTLLAESVPEVADVGHVDASEHVHRALVPHAVEAGRVTQSGGGQIAVVDGVDPGYAPAESGPVVVDVLGVHGEPHRVHVVGVGAQERQPLDVRVAELVVQRAAHVGDLRAAGTGPGAALAPVAADLLPQAHGRGAEARMGLALHPVLVAADGHQRVVGEQAPQPSGDGTDREGVPVDEHQEVVGLGGGDHHVSQHVEFVGVHALAVRDDVELGAVGGVLDPLQ